MAEQITREEAIQFLTMQRDLYEDAKRQVRNETANAAGGVDLMLRLLEQAGDTVGYAPAFRCLVKGLEPEESIRWGK